MSNPLRVLLIESDPSDAELIQTRLATIQNPPIQLGCADRLSTGLTRLAGRGFDLVLLDLNLPDCRGFATFTKTSAAAPGVPVIVLTNIDDEALALRTVRDGAQDYLFKKQVDSSSLAHAIRCAIERHRMAAELRTCSLLDELTGLYNRRGFLALAEQQCRWRIEQTTGWRSFLPTWMA